MSKREPVAVPCEHETWHPEFDPSLLRKCKGTSLIECVKCLTLIDEK